MENPWENLPTNPPYILPEELRAVDNFNERCNKQECKILTHLLPDPYLGNIDAPVVLLNLNPGYNGSEDELHKRAEFIKVCRNNLLHGETKWSNYYFDPHFHNTEGYKWWSNVARKTIEVVSPEKFSQNILIVEYFPYHSSSFKPMKEILPSQMYSGYLVKKAIERDACIVIMRGESEWLELVPELKHFEYLTLSNKQRGWISEGNMKGDHSRFIEKLMSSIER